MKFLVLLAIVAYVAADVQSPPVFRILKQSSDVRPDGYEWNFETENGITAQEQGQTRQIGQESPIVANGGYQYTAPDGTPIQVNYIADENGFQPQGAHLPVAPPVPVAIARALEWIAAHPQQEQTK